MFTLVRSETLIVPIITDQRLRLCQVFAPICPHILKTVARTSDTESNMPLLANVLGFSVFGLAVRMGQLGIQRRNLLDST
jgi:hypothetical protein